MAQWIDKLLGLARTAAPEVAAAESGGGGKLPVADDIPALWTERLRTFLVPVRESSQGRARKGLVEDLASWVARGEPSAVLDEVSGKLWLAEMLMVLGHWPLRRGELFNLYQAFPGLPAAAGLRWALLLESGVRTGQEWCFHFPGLVHWPEILLVHATGGGLGSHSSEKPRGLTAAKFEELFLAAGLPASALVSAAFASPVEANYLAPERLRVVRQLADWSAAVERHVAVVGPLLAAGGVAQRQHVLALLRDAAPTTLAALLDGLCELATSSSKQVRSAAEPLVRRAVAAAGLPGGTAALRRLAVEARPEGRTLALRLLVALAERHRDDDSLAFARTTAAADKAASVRGLVEEWAARQAIAALAADEEGAPAAPPTAPLPALEVPTIEWATPVGADLERALDQLWRDLDGVIDRLNAAARQFAEWSAAQGHAREAKLHVPYSPAERASLRAAIESTRPAQKGPRRELPGGWQNAQEALSRFAAAPGVTSTALLEVLAFFRLDGDQRGALNPTACEAFNNLHAASGRPTLLELAEMLQALGHHPRTILLAYCTKWGRPLAGDWPEQAVWPFFARHHDLFAAELAPKAEREHWFDRSLLFRALATLPQPPADLVDPLFSLALGTARSERRAAQQALDRFAGKERRIVAALADSRAEVRSAAAAWLGRLRHGGAREALETALAREKNDSAKGAILDALQQLGQPIERYLDRAVLGEEAKKGLAKGIPVDLAWFPWEALPTVRWADSGAEVPNEVLRWLLVQACRQKSPEPNALLRRFCSLMVPRDREPWGQFVLEAWLREDVRPVPHEEARVKAEALARTTHAAMQRAPKYYQNDPNFGRSVEELIARFLPMFLRQPAGSAIASKGVLAVAAACAAERAAAPVGRYLKEHYGMRMAQGKALIQMLAWIEHPSAAQLMLSVGSRFRTKSLQEEATRQAEALAERQGWTLGELADRTIPTAGFDESGTLTLSFGLREFNARLLPDFRIELFNPDGKKIAALPEPRQDDDATAAADAKKTFANAKKEIKSIVTLQTDRLYEALCTERTWPGDDWQRYLAAHPVARHLVQRLVWIELAADGSSRSLRPLDDGTFTNRDDEAVVLAADSTIRLAHDSLLAPEEVAAWQRHLVDYEITPLFEQLGKGVWALPPEQARSRGIKDFQGHLLEAFALRGRALKLGYARGQAEDGGWFYVYEKRFATLGLVAVLSFTGNPLPEENRTVGLLELSFVRSGDESWQRAALALGDVPKILLSECYHDLRLLAAEGSGFDPEWQKKTRA